MAIRTAPHLANQVSAPGGFVEAVPTLDTSIYAIGDLLFDATEIAQAVTWSGGYGTLRSVDILDEDAQGIAFDLLVLNAGDSLGSLNAAFAASDTLCRGIVAIVPVATADLFSARVRAIADLCALADARVDHLPAASQRGWVERMADISVSRLNAIQDLAGISDARDEVAALIEAV